NWWIIAFGILFTFMVLMANLAPTLLFPLFYKFTPLENASLKEKLTKLSEENGVKVNGIFEMDMSKNTKKANAALAGIGNTKRIILSDTLLKDFTEEEIETIIAHELGHKNYNHIFKLMGVQTILMFLVFYLSNVVLNSYYASFGFRGIDDIAALPLLLITLTLVSLISMPIANSLSRFFEVQADTFALKTTQNAKSFISAMERLAAINLAEKEPNAIKEFIFYSHPSIAKRVALANSFSKKL
ncbi:MAG: M48 family metalloprotease, partial [Nitrospinae bacterium]|nr:M48 family metalloprotease [Nitrospinota bacterium]